jgi:CBS domain containing-hemolysin-like protein
MTVLLISLLTALLISALCSVSEATLLSLSGAQIETLRARHPAIAAIWTRFKADIEKPISTILILNTSAHTAGAFFAGSKFAALYGEAWMGAFSAGFTFVMLQFTEILPKSLGVRLNTTFAVLIARPLDTLSRLLAPIIWLTRLLNRPFEGRAAHGEATVAEIAALAGLARLSNEIGARQEQIIRGAPQLSRLRADDLMIPIDQVAMIPADHTLDNALLDAHLDAHTRFPVHDTDSRDRVVGYVNFKELVAHMRTNPTIGGLEGVIRPVRFVAPELPADKLLGVFVDERVHIAMVGDATQALGLVTLEDVIEELVGEIEDEFDRLPRTMHKLAGSVWMIGGGVPVERVSELTGVPLDGQGTLAAWVEEQLGRLPVRDDELPLRGHILRIRRCRRGRVFEATLVPRTLGPRDGEASAVGD